MTAGRNLVSEFTVDELIVTCIARQIRDGDVVGQGIATPLVAAGYMLAWRTHAPNLWFASAIGQCLCQAPGPIGLARAEAAWLDQAVGVLTFGQVVADWLPRMRPKEFFRPAQVDQNGNFNNIAIGEDYRRPLLRLPGTGGIPDVSTYFDELYLYVPRHSKVTFAERLDFRSGLGHHPARTRGGGPCYLVSDLGQFDFDQGRMRLTSLHPGATLERIQARTGFPLEVAPELDETPPPTTEELRLLREEIDPLGVRRLELLSGAARRELLRVILDREMRR